MALAIAGIRFVLDRARLELAGELILEVTLLVPRERELVLLRRLERQASAGPSVGLHRLDRPRRVRRVHEVAHAGVLEQVRHASRRTPPPPGREEPQPIGQHGSADRAVEVVHLLHAIDRREPLCDQVLVQIVALQAVARATDEKRSAESVPAIFRNAVDLCAAERVFG